MQRKLDRHMPRRGKLWSTVVVQNGCVSVKRRAPIALIRHVFGCWHRVVTVRRRGSVSKELQLTRRSG